MLKTLRNAFKIKDIRKKLLYTFMALIVVRIGSQIPIPGVNKDYFAQFFAAQSSLSFFDALTGGSFTTMSIFALNITPYITSSIIMQLLTIAIPKLEEIQKDGEDGRRKIAEYTRYVTVALAVIEGLAMAIGFGNQGLLTNGISFASVVVTVTTLTAGSAFLMWLGENITEKGVGNGISVILLINIVSRIPQDMVGLYNKFIVDTTMVKAVIAVIIIVAVIVGMVVFIIVIQNGQRKIPVQYAKKVQGRKMVGGQSSSIPLKVNTAGVIPVIFASSIMQFPIVIANFLGTGEEDGIGSKILKVLNQQEWCDFSSLSEFKYTLGLVLYIVLIIFFAYFYTSVTFNPIEVANNMKKQGGFIPGIRPGRPTTEYLTKVLNNIIFIGAAGLTIVAIVPIFFSGAFGADVSFSGTSLIIIVGVVLETMKQIESQMLVRHYKGFLND